EPTRVCTTILDRATGTTTELVENARKLATDEVDAFVAAFAEESAHAKVVVLTGSLPAGVTDRFYSDLLAHPPGQAILDVAGSEWGEGMEQRPMVVKPNREELSKPVGRSLTNDRELLSAMREINRAGAQWVVVTSGKDALFVSSSDEAYRLVPP